MSTSSPVNGTASPGSLMEVLTTVTTGQTTVQGLTEHPGSVAVSEHPYSAGAGNETFLNGTGILSTGASQEEGDYLWLTLRLFFIACFITGLIVLTWGSYTIHRKCFDERPKRKYQKALLL